MFDIYGEVHDRGKKWGIPATGQMDTATTFGSPEGGHPVDNASWCIYSSGF